MPTRRNVLELGALGGAALIIGVRWDGDAFAATGKRIRRLPVPAL